MRNNNRASIRRLSGRSLKNNRMRNVFAVLAIALTGILFTAVFSLTSGAMQAAQEETMREVGGRFHAGIKAATREQYEKTAEDPMVAKSSYTIYLGRADNIRKRQAEIRFTPKEDTLSDLFIELKEGRMPTERNEIIVDTFVFDELKLPCAIGEKIPLRFTFMGETVEEEFVVCGWYEGDAIAHASELFVSESYWIDLKGGYTDEDFAAWKEIHPEDAGVGLYAGNFFFEDSNDLENKIRTVIENAGYEPEKELAYGVNWAYMSSRAEAVDPLTLTILLGAVIVILLTGYLIIYNIFQISVVGDIRFYGLLKTIGTTKRQIRALVRRQAFLLSVIGIPIGLFIGFGVGRVALPFMLSIADSQREAAVALRCDPRIFIAGALFSALTVFLSSRKPGKIAGSVSPIEAVRYVESSGIKKSPARHAKRSREKNLALRYAESDGEKEPAPGYAEPGGEKKSAPGYAEPGGEKEPALGCVKMTGKKQADRREKRRNRDRGHFSALSMALANLGRNRRTTTAVISAISLSMILLAVVMTAVGSFQVDGYIGNRIAGDFLLANINVASGTARSADLEIAPEFLALADEQEGVEGKAEMWMQYRTFLRIDDGAMEKLRELDAQEKLRRDAWSVHDLEKMLGGEADFGGRFYGYSEELLSGLEVLDGTLDIDKFMTGDYILLTTILGEEELPPEEHIYRPGDRVTVRSYMEEASVREIRDASGEVVDVAYENPVEKEYEVMAIVRIPYSMNIHRYYANACDVVLPLSEIEKDSGYADLFAVSYQVAEEKKDAFRSALDAYTEGNPEMGYVSRESLREEFGGMVMVIATIGITLSAVIALIGILNFTNAMITEVISRRREFAVLQSIGMTGGQLRKTLIFEGISYVAASGAVSFVLGSILSYVILKAMNNMILFFEYRFQILPFVIMTPVLVLASVLVPVLAWKRIGRRSIVERLREE